MIFITLYMMKIQYMIVIVYLWKFPIITGKNVEIFIAFQI